MLEAPAARFEEGLPGCIVGELFERLKGGDPSIFGRGAWNAAPA
jgi:hypothetical protein